VLNFVDLAGSEKVSSHYEIKEYDESQFSDFTETFTKIDD
jgi:hypothetical protein